MPPRQKRSGRPTHEEHYKKIEHWAKAVIESVKYLEAGLQKGDSKTIRMWIADLNMSHGKMQGHMEGAGLVEDENGNWPLEELPPKTRKLVEKAESASDKAADLMYERPPTRRY